MEEKIFKLLKLYLPHFSQTHFVKNAIRLEKAQMLYLLVYHARFEMISHFLFGPYHNYIKTPDEFIEGMFEGQGGICFERAMALKFLLEFFDIAECRFVMGGSLPQTNRPINFEEVKANLLDTEKNSISPYAHHAAIIAIIDNEEWLLDPNGGRLGKIFLNPFLTKLILSEDFSKKFGVLASFGQMFYHRVADELFHLAVAYRRSSDLQAFNFLMTIGLVVGSNFDIFISPKQMISERFKSLYPHRVQTMCWQIQGNLLEELSKYNLEFVRTPGHDRFLERIKLLDSLLDFLFNNFSQASEILPLQMVLRISTTPWDHFTQIAPALSEAFMMS